MARAKTKTARARTTTRAASRPARTARTTTRASAPAASPAEAPIAITELITRLPNLDAAHRAAFESQFADAECATRGAATRSAQVRAGALLWAGTAAPALLDPAHAPEIDYGPERLAWLVELIARLDAARADARHAGDARTTVRTARDVAREHASAVRRRLITKLARVVRGDAAAQATLDAAGAAPDDTALVRSLDQLANLIDALVARGGATAVLLRSARVTADDARAAREAIAVFSRASDQVGVGGRSQGDRDTAAINVVEGRVLFELTFLRDAFDEARSRGVPVPPLVPPTGLQRALGRTRPRPNTDASSGADAPAGSPSVAGASGTARASSGAGGP